MRPMVVDLPPHFYDGIGKVISAHAILESQVQEMLFDFMIAEYPAGRVAFAYRHPAPLFQIISRLFDLWGIDCPTKLYDLETEIRDRTRKRDELAHGVWLLLPDGRIALRLIEGKYETAHGTRDRAFLPEPMVLDDKYFERTRSEILETAKTVNALKDSMKPKVQAAYEALQQKRGEPSINSP